jgi:hypothetical protein
MMELTARMKQEVHAMMELNLKNGLPQGPIQRTAEAGQTSAPTVRKYGILVVDDDGVVRVLLEEGLHGQGLDVWPPMARKRSNYFGAIATVSTLSCWMFACPAWTARKQRLRSNNWSRSLACVS